VRKPNEGSKLDKKWVNAKPLVKDDDEDFISGTYGKAKRERERKTKQVVDIDQRYVEPERSRGGRGGRGGRGAPRGDARGAPRGGGGGGGASAGGGRGRGRENVPINTNDKQAFPSLGK
jgi:plasminogen activator inhibitor 1 RNA-binding protein